MRIERRVHQHLCCIYTYLLVVEQVVAPEEERGEDDGYDGEAQAEEAADGGAGDGVCGGVLLGHVAVGVVGVYVCHLCCCQAPFSPFLCTYLDTSTRPESTKKTATAMRPSTRKKRSARSAGVGSRYRPL